MTDSQKDSPLVTGAVGPHMLKLCLPPMVAMFAVFSYYLVDAYFVAKLGLQQLAAFSFASPICFLFITIGVGFGIGLTSMISNNVGKHGIIKSKPLVRDGYILSLLMAVIFVLCGQFTIQPLFTLMGASTEIIGYVEIYMRIWYMALFFIFLQICSSNIIRSTTGQSLLPAISSLLSAVINIILDPILIFGWGSIPAFGIAGSAYATLIASIFTFTFTFAIVLHKKLIIWQMPKFMTMVRKHWRPIVPIFLFATVENVTPAISETIMVSLSSRFGDEAVVSLGIISRFYLILLTPYIGIFIGITPFIGQNWGAGKPERVKQAMIFGAKISISYAIITVTMMYFLSGFFATQFTDEPQIIAWVEFFYQYVYFTIIGFAIVNLVSAVFYGMKRAILPCMLQLLIMFLLVSGALILMYLFDFTGILLADLASMPLAGLVAIFLLFRLNLFKQQKPKI